MNRRKFFAGAVATLTALPFVGLPADAAATNVRSSLVTIRATGLLRASNELSDSVFGTGFFVNSQGYIVTSLHLIKQLGAVIPESIRFEVNTDLNETPITAIQIERRDQVDILVLLAKMGMRPFSVLRRERNVMRRVREGETRVYTSGFPKGYGAIIDNGAITSFEGPVSPPSPTWTTNMTFKGGQSGSPIYLEDGSVIAVAKGVDAGTTQIGIVVPIMHVPLNYWDEDTEAPANMEAAEGIPSILITRNVPATATQSRIVPINVQLSSCSDPGIRNIRVDVSPGWKISATPATVQMYEARGASIRTRVINQQAHMIEVLVEMDMSNCSEPPVFKGGVRFDEIPGPDAVVQMPISESLFLRNRSIPLGQDSISDLSISFLINGEKTEPRSLAASDVRTINGELAIRSSALSVQLDRAQATLPDLSVRNNRF